LLKRDAGDFPITGVFVVNVQGAVELSDEAALDNAKGRVTAKVGDKGEGVWDVKVWHHSTSAD
jgi:hypothetical protein